MGGANWAENKKKSAEKDQGEEATARLAAAREISVDALSELDDCFHNKRSTNHDTEGFSLLLTNYSKNFWGSFELLLSDSSGSKKSDWSTLNVADRRFMQSPSNFLASPLEMLSIGSLADGYVE